MHPSRSIRRGFTVIEMLAAVAAAALLALTFVVLIAASYRAMRWNTNRVNDQRDLTAALQVIDHLVRPAARYGITSSSGRVEVVRGSSTAAVYAVNSNLIIDPNIGAGGDSVVVLNGCVASFMPTLTNTSLRMTLLLKGRVDTTVVHSVVAFRNSP